MSYKKVKYYCMQITKYLTFKKEWWAKGPKKVWHGILGRNFGRNLKKKIKILVR